MKKIVVVLALGLTSLTALAQTSAIMQLESGKLDKAKAEIDKATEDPKQSGKAKTWFTRGRVYEAIASDPTGVYAKLDTNASIKAYESYKKALEVEPGGGKSGKEINEALTGDKLYRALMSQGAGRYQTKNFADAIKMMSLAGEVMPKDTTAALYTGISAQQAKETTLAKKEFERYMANGGKDVGVIYSLASLYRNDKETDKALVTLDKGLKLIPGNKDLSAERVNILMTSGKMEEAVVGMKQLVEKDPKNVQNILNLAILYDNGATKMSADIAKLTDGAKKGGTLTKKLATEKDALDAFNAEIVRLNAAIKKTPAKAADLKRQLATAQASKAERQTSVTQLEAQVKEEAAKGVNSADMEKQAADLKAKQAEQRELAKTYYNQALAIEPANFDANYNMGIFFFNDAVELKKQVDNMSMADYQKSGKEVEGRVCGKFKQTLPYWEKAKSVKADDETLNENLTSLQNILKQFEEKKIVCVDAK